MAGGWYSHYQQLRGLEAKEMEDGRESYEKQDQHSRQKVIIKWCANMSTLMGYI